MSNTAAAIRAAREVQADTRAPELFRQSNEWFFKARQEYKLKNFKEARIYASKARRFAEEAEYEELNSGANRVSAPPDPLGNVGAEPAKEDTRPSKSLPMEGVPKEEKPKLQQGVFVESYEEQEAFKRKVELEKAAHPPAPSNPTVIQNYQPGTVLPTPIPKTTP